MEFSEKLTALFALTAAKSAELADAAGLGRPYVSRLKKGERGMPGKLFVVRAIASFFASRCTDDYRRRALSDLTGDIRMRDDRDEAALAGALFQWLSGAPAEVKTPAGRFIHSVEVFSPGDYSAEGAFSAGNPPDAHGVVLYHGNAGKREALRDFIACIDEADAPCRVLLFTDETYDWLVEDADFSRWLNGKLCRMADAGVTFERIQPPFNDVEFNFSSITRWLPAYMAGAMQQLHYPFSRDRLHRRTLFLVPGRVSMSADSVAGERAARVTLLTREKELVLMSAEEYAAIRARCLPAMMTFSADSEKWFTEAEAVAALPEEGVYKTRGLSVNTLPPLVTERIWRLGTPYARRACESFERRGRSRALVLRDHAITDIMSLPDLSEVRAGASPIPGTQAMPGGALYYTADEYRAHVERVLWHLSVFPNYRAIFTDDTEDNVIMYVKGVSRALLVKQGSPSAVFDVTEPMMAAAFCEYLKRIVEEKSAPDAREKAVERLRAELKRIDSI